jgi:hypothetical protein
MANRYWVCGLGSWNTTNTNNWSATSGVTFTGSCSGTTLTTTGSPALLVGMTVVAVTGTTNIGTITGGSGNTWTVSVGGTVSSTMHAGTIGASVPTSADDVFINAASSASQVNATASVVCRSLDFTGYGNQFTQAAATTLSVHGNFTASATMLYTSSGTLSFAATSGSYTITTNGKFINSVSIGSGVTTATWSLADTLNVTFSLIFSRGTFNTNNNAINAESINIAQTNTYTINLGSSVVTVSGTNDPFRVVNDQNMTLNTGTSTIVFSGALAGGINLSSQAAGRSYYNLSFPASGAFITGLASANNITITAPPSPGVRGLSLSQNLTLANGFTILGSAGNRRVRISSSDAPLRRTITYNGAGSLVDVDFFSIIFNGTASPPSGTRIGSDPYCLNLTTSAPKTVYWNQPTGGSWNSDSWTDTPGGTVSTDFFPLPQDTAVIVDTGLNSGATITLTGITHPIGSLDYSSRTLPTVLSNSAGLVPIYGDLTLSTAVTVSGTQALGFYGGTLQTLISAGRTVTTPITVNSYGGTLRLGDSLTGSANTLLTVTAGSFTTQNYPMSIQGIVSTNANVRSISLGTSNVTLSSGGAPINFTDPTNLTFNAGQSTITFTGANTSFQNGGQTFWDVVYTSTGTSTYTINGNATFNNLTFASRSTAGVSNIALTSASSLVVNGTMTISGGSAVRRNFIYSTSQSTQSILTVNNFVADNCDFRNINLAGAASGASPTRAGDCGGNTGITFPAPKTVYWNLAGSQNWTATAWASSSGGTPDINNFPLAQDTAVFDNTGSAGTVTISTLDCNIGTFDASLRTSAMTLSVGTNAPEVHGDWTFGTGVTSSSTTGSIAFVKDGLQTITSNGVSFGCNVSVSHDLAYVQLADAISLQALRSLVLARGTFDAVTYNVTTPSFSNSTTNSAIVRMGSGTWTLTGTSTVWDMTITPNFFVGTSTIVLSDTSTSARTFNGGSLYYNKLTIGGVTGTSTLTIGGATFGELASIKTVAHTISFGATNVTIGKWSVTGTAGNVVTISGAALNTIAGPAVTGVDYLAMGTWGLIGTSPGEFYAGANSTGTAAAPVFRTAAPAPRTLYWVGGTGNWSSTTKWSTSSGGASGAAIPTSLDAVIFNSASNATSYTATIDAGVTLARCASFTMAGPASGNVTFAGSVGIAFHGNVSFAATGIIRTYTGAMQWAGNSSYTFTTNGLTLASSTTVIGVGSTWSLGFNTNLGASATLTVTYGTFSTSLSNYSLTASSISSSNSNIRSIILNGSTLTLGGITPVTLTQSRSLTFDAGSSTINSSNSSPSFSGGGLAFNNVSFTNTSPVGSVAITGANTFNALSFAGRTTVGIEAVTFDDNQTISTLTLNAGTGAAFRRFLCSDTINEQRTLNVTTLTAGATDIDFRDIVVTGAAAPLTGTRFGNAGNNSGITFPAAKTVYYINTGSANWGTTGAGSWSATSGGSADATQFPLAQDTAIFSATTYPASGSTTTVNADYNIGTINMAARTSNTMILATSTNAPIIYGDWLNGTGTTVTGALVTFAGDGPQTINCNGKSFSGEVYIDKPTGTLSLGSAFSTSGAIPNLFIRNGTFDAGIYNVTAGAFSLSGGVTNMGSGTWSATGSGTAWNATSGATINKQTANISLGSTVSRTFAGGDKVYNKLTLAGAGTSLTTITGNNTFSEIASTRTTTTAHTILELGATTTTVSAFTVAGNVSANYTVSGTSAKLINPTGFPISTNRITWSSIYGYNLSNTWYVGANSINNGSLGLIFTAPPPNYGRFFLMFG